MKRMLRLALAAGAVWLAVGPSLACGGNEATAPATAQRPAPPPPQAPPPPPPPPPPSPLPQPAPPKATPQPVVIRIVVRDGRVVGGLKRATIKQGSRAVLAVTADVTDEVHLHGYDLKRRVAPGRPARLAFRARLPGTFEVELEERGFKIAELRVRP